MEKLERIKELYEKIVDKNDFYEATAAEFGLTKGSVRVNWFGSFIIPERYGVRESLIEFMEKYISNQSSPVENE